MDAFMLVTILTYICLPFSLLLNGLLMLVVLRHSAKYLIPYRQPMLIINTANATLSICYMLSQHTFVLRKHVLFVFFLGPAQFAPQGVCYIAEFVNVALFLFTCHQPLLIFVYRYQIIFSSKTPSRLHVYLGAVAFLAFNLLVSFIYFFFSRATLSSSDEAKYQRWAKDIRRSPNPAFLLHQASGYGKVLSLIFFMFHLTGYVGIYVMHELICYRLKTSRHAVSHSRTLQMARAIIAMTVVTSCIGFLPYSIMQLSVVFDVELGVWAIPISLGSAFIPIMAPITMFYKVDAYRSSLRGILLEFYHHLWSAASPPTSDQQSAKAQPTQ